MIKRILITPGEPAGVGPDLTVHIAQHAWPAELIVIADPDLLLSRAKQLNLPLTLEPFDAKTPAKSHTLGTLKIIPVSLTSACHAGQLNKENAAYVIRCLELAVDRCLDHTAHALVTGPVQKSILNEAGIAFTGHTEFLAACSGAKQPLMLFVTPEMKVALATTHLPLSEVPHAITSDHLKSILRLLHAELKNQFGLANPHILVCGLNPHAGEGGHLGREEIEIISPALDELRVDGMNITGPLPADTLFTEKKLASADAVLAMFHDQALPVVKYRGFGECVNVTLGLPLIRTSVDHGTALDVAGTQKAEPDSLISAIKLAIKLAT